MNSLRFLQPTLRWPMARWPRLGWLGLALLLLVIVAALLAPWLTPHDPQALVAIPFQPPSSEHLLGTDDLGHDIFSQLLFGARLSLLIGFLSAIFALVVALTVALTAAYAQGLAEMALLRLIDITLSFPFLPLVIVLAAFLGRELGVTIVAITTVLWARPALILHAQAAKIRTFQHVAAAVAMGATPLYVMVRHMLPRLFPLAAAQFVRTANVAIFLEAAMAFLGLGDPNRISWGTMLYFANSSSAMLTDAWRWWVLPVGLALTVTIVGLAYLGFAIEGWADPRLITTATRTAVPPQTKVTPPQTPSSLFSVHNLSIAYGHTHTVTSVDLTINKGEIVGLIGASGCGKSTLATALLRLKQAPQHVTTGQVWWNGRSLFTLSPADMTQLRGREISLIPQNAMSALNPVYTVHRQVAEVTQLEQSKTAASQHATELLNLVGLPTSHHTAYPHELSGGMRQRVVIAIAIANSPQLLIADEPTTGLDVVTQREILQLLLNVRQKFDMSMLLISHNLPLIGKVADEILVMQVGQIVERGTAQQLLTAPRHPHTQQLLTAMLPLPERVEENENVPRVVTRDTSRAGNYPPNKTASSHITAPALQLEKVSKSFHRRGLLANEGKAVTAVSNFSLTIQPAEIVALVGESGAGKSTLAQLVLGLEQADSGQIHFAGTNITRLAAATQRQVRQQMHLIFQDPYQSLHPSLRVAQLVTEPLTISGKPKQEKHAQAALALEAVGLQPADKFMIRFPHELSGGQRQRVALARALISRPKLIIADEPTSMLDVALQATILQLIDTIRTQNQCAVLLITHDLRVAYHIADRIAVMKSGKLVEIGTAAQIIRQPQHAYTKQLLGNEQ